MANIKLPRKPKEAAKCLSTVSKFLSSEWDYTLNTFTPEDISYGSIFKVWWLCSTCGHSWQSSINNRYLKGSNCPMCANKARGVDQTLTIDFISQSMVDNLFWELLSTDYISAKTKLLCKCKTCGNIHNISWDKIKQGRRCYKCSLSNRSELYKGKPPWAAINARIPDFDFIKSNFMIHNYTLISTTYISSDKHLHYKCPLGHKHSMSWDNWNQGKRCPTCKNINNSGSNHPMWLGGKSFEPYCPIWKDIDYKESIKIRDNYICQNPYCFNTTNKLAVHHIDYDKKNCHPSNLVTVCGPCNIRANKDREWHTEWYQTIMNKKFGYNY